MTFKITRNKSVVASLILKSLGGGDYEIEYAKVDSAWRGKGLATVLLNRAIEYASACEWTLVGFVDPPRDSSLTHDQIKEWLKRHGFKYAARYDFGGYTKPVMILSPDNKSTNIKPL